MTARPAEAEVGAERAIEEACAAGDFALATTRALEAYGAEILSFLVARLRAETDAEEAFAMFAEDLWKALPTFERRCSARGYLYTIARNAANRYAKAPHRRRDRNLPAADAVLESLIEHARTTTRVYQRTEVKDKMRALRDRLAADDQMLLTLHIDRALPWREIAIVMGDDGQSLDDAELTREAARLRKRFERLKAELKEIAKKEGLIAG